MTYNPRPEHETDLSEQEFLKRDSGIEGPSDLESTEASVALWFKSLERRTPDASLRESVLTGEPGVRQPGVRQPAGRLLRMFPLGAWGVATAALLLVALGAGLAVETFDPVSPAPAPSAERAGRPAKSMVIVEDPTMALFHDLATFDEVGRDQDELIADWQR